MVVVESPEWLPPGFAVKIKYKDGKKVRYFINVATGKKYNSKKEVIRCATEDNTLVTPQTKNGDNNLHSSINKVDVIPDKINDSTSWLRDGWAVERKIRKTGLAYKVYTDLSSGRKFYSKAAVTRYLSTIDHSDTATRQNKSFNNVATGKKYNSKKEVIRCATEDNTLVAPQTKNGDNNLQSSINKVDVIPDKINDSTSWLHDGWAVERKIRKTGLAYKVYTDLSSGRKFYSKAAVTRYLSTIDHSDKTTRQNKIDSVDEPRQDMSPEVLPMTSTGNIHGKKRKINSFAKIENVNELVAEKLLPVTSMIETGGVHEQKRKGNSLVMIDNVDEPFPDMSSQVISKTNTDGIRGKKRKRCHFVTVSAETTTPVGLPSGWIKEIRTSMSGNKTRKDPFYIDPTNGYIFRSKPDVLRYLKTNDIRYCFSRPRKTNLDGIKLIENKTPSSNPASEKLSVHKQPLFSGEESNGGVESSGTKSPAERKTKISKRKPANCDSVKVLEGKISCENSNKDAEIRNKPKSESDLSKNGADVAVSSQATVSKSRMGSRKPKKRSCSSLPLRKSNRLAGSEPEMQSNLDLNEPSTRAAVEGFTGNKIDASPVEASDSIPQTSNIEPANEAIASDSILQTSNIKLANEAIASNNIRQASNMEVEASDSIPRTSNIDPANEVVDHAVVENLQVERPPTESSAIPEEPSGEKASEKPLNDDQRPHEPHLCYDFGDSWSDPLEFALKTLTGEMPVNDNLTFSSCFGQQFDTPCLNQSQFDAPISFQSEFVKKSESSKKHNADDPLPASSSSNLSALGNIDFGFNYQPKAESFKEHYAVDSLPASSPTPSALGNIDFGFNYQPKAESLKEYNAVGPLPASSPTLSVLGNIDFGFNYPAKSESFKEQNAVDPLPASSPSLFSPANFGFSSYSGFNYQPKKEAGKKDSQTKFNP